MSALRERCGAFINSIDEGYNISKSAINDLEAFVLSEIARAASTKLEGSNALVMFFETPEGRDAVAQAISDAAPGMVERKWP